MLITTKDSALRISDKIFASKEASLLTQNTTHHSSRTRMMCLTDSFGFMHNTRSWTKDSRQPKVLAIEHIELTLEKWNTLLALLLSGLFLNVHDLLVMNKTSQWSFELTLAKLFSSERQKWWSARNATLWVVLLRNNDLGVSKEKGKYLFPFRTQKSSLSSAMVLQGKPCGRVARCSHIFL